MVQKVVYAEAWTGHYLAFKKIEHAVDDMHFGADVDHSAAKITLITETKGTLYMHF